jgi:hypothetical protein
MGLPTLEINSRRPTIKRDGDIRAIVHLLNGTSTPA